MTFGLALMVERFKALLERLGVRYDEWFWESGCGSRALAQRAIDRLRENRAT